MNFIDYVESLKQELRKENLIKIREEIDSVWVRNKITNFISRWNGIFSYDDIRERILFDDLIAASFAKDPGKQNIGEKAVMNLIGTDKKLPASGKNCVRFDEEGNIKQLAGANVSKSADFLINDIYYTKKYTNESGGAQDNQFHDVVDFLTKGSKQYKVGAILDGHYWLLRINEVRDFLKAMIMLV